MAVEKMTVHEHEMTVDKMPVDKMAVDEMSVDEMTCIVLRKGTLFTTLTILEIKIIALATSLITKCNGLLHGILTKGIGSVQLTSSLRLLVL